MPYVLALHYLGVTTYPHAWIINHLCHLPPYQYEYTSLFGEGWFRNASRSPLVINIPCLVRGVVAVMIDQKKKGGFGVDVRDLNNPKGPEPNPPLCFLLFSFFMLRNPCFAYLDLVPDTWLVSRLHRLRSPRYFIVKR